MGRPSSQSPARWEGEGVQQAAGAHIIARLPRPVGEQSRRLLLAKVSAEGHVAALLQYACPQPPPRLVRHAQAVRFTSPATANKK